MRSARSGLARWSPVYAQIHEFVAHIKGIPNTVFYTQPKIMVAAMLEVQAEYGLEVATITFDVYNIEAQGLGQKLVFDDRHIPDIDRQAPLIRDRSDLRLIRTPDFEKVGRFRYVVEVLRCFKAFTGIEASLPFCAPFTLAANVRGIQQLLIDIYTDPDFARELLTRLTEEVLTPYLLYQKTFFPNAEKANGADAFASLPICNLDVLENWCTPYIQRLGDLTGLDVTVVNWVGESYLKNPSAMLDLKRQISDGAIQGQDPDVELLSPEFYARYAKEHNASLTLGVGAAFLAQATPAQVRERVRRYAEAGLQAERFILYLCNVNGATPPENLRAALQTARDVIKRE